MRERCSSRAALALDVSVAEHGVGPGPLPGGRRLRWISTPHAAALVKGWHAVMVQVVGLCGRVRPQAIAAIAQDRFDSGHFIDIDQAIDVPHRSQMRRRVVFLTSRDAFEEGHGRNSTAANVDDRRVEQLVGDQGPSHGPLDQRREPGVAGLGIVGDPAVEERAQSRFDCPTNLGVAESGQCQIASDRGGGPEQ
jgi:hypothetical protein